MKAPPRLKTFWFDLGNVLLHFDFGPAFRRLSSYTDLDPAGIARYFRARPDLEADVDEGRIGARDLYRRLSRDLRLEGVGFPRFKRIWNDIFEENRPVTRLLPALKKSGYRLILISNTNRLHYEHVKSRHPFLGLFDGVVLSYRVGARKPQKAIYRDALRRSRARPKEIFYIDDRRDLTRAAFFDHGIHVHTYRNVRDLRRALRRFGVAGGAPGG